MASHLTNIFDGEARLYEFECAIDMIDKISDSLVEDRATSNALVGVHKVLCNLHAEFKAHMIED